MNETIKRLFSSPGVLIALAYTVSYGLMLLNRGLFWEDWAIYNHIPSDNIVFFRDLGYFFAWPGYLYAALSHTAAPVLLARGMVFFSFLFSALFLNSVLKTVKEVGRDDRLVIGLLFAVFPFFTFRFAYGTLHYSLSYFSFFAGMYLLSAYFNRGSVCIRALYLLCFAFACTTRSFLVLCLLPALYILYRMGGVSIRSIVRHADFFSLPLLIFALNKHFFPPLAEYAVEGYNAIQLKRIILFPLILVKNYAVNISYSIRSVMGGWGWTAVFFAGFFFAGRAMDRRAGHAEDRGTAMRMFLLGVLIFAAGAFPYIVIGKNPLPGSVDRFQLLIPLGAAVTVTYAFRLMFSSAALYAQGALVVLFAAANFLTSLDHQRFWYKKVAFMENARVSEEIVASNNLFVQDNTIYTHTLPLDMAFYEYSGIFRLVFGDQTRTAYCQPGDMVSMNIVGGFRERYNLKDYVGSHPQLLMRLEPGDLRLSRPQTLKLLFQEYTSPVKFLAETKKAVRLEFERVTPSTVLRPCR
jgi:hypothetical protein